MDNIRYERSEGKVTFGRPVMVCAFEGWNDAADAATGALRFLASRWQAEPFAHIDPEPFFDFQVRRPRVTLVDGITRRIEWPASDFFSASIPGAGRDALLFAGIEPNFRWRTYTQLFVDMAQSYGVEMVVTLGALLADVPHTRAVRVVGTAGKPELVERMGLLTSRYEGPSGIVGVLHDAMARAGLDSVSLWASVPHYVSAGPNPKATVALVERLGELVGTEIDTDELEAAGQAWESKVTEIVEANSEISTYVRQLESAADQLGGDEADLPSGDVIAEELERFLRDQEGGGPPEKRRSP